MVRRLRSAGQSVSGSSVGGHVIQVGSTTGNVQVLLDRLDYRLEPFTLTTDQQRRVPRSQCQPSYLLDPQREVVPYRQRFQEEQTLTMWLDDAEEPVSVLMVFGAGGQGKTRLANHVASLAHANKWVVIQGVESNRQPQADNSRQMVPGEGQSLLVIVDYAERWRLGILVQLVHDLLRDHSDRRVRILLLARPGPGVWEAIAAELDGGVVDLAEPVELGEFVHDEKERAKAFRVAAEAFASKLGTTMPRELKPPADLSSANYSSPLTLHMSALATVCATRDKQPVPSVRNLSRYLLRHEHRYWTATAHAGYAPSAEVIQQVVFIATLFGPVAGLSAGCELLCQARLADGVATARQVLMSHERLYPSNRFALSDASGDALADVEMLLPLRPDRFGEDFVGQYLAQRRHAAPLLAELLATERDVLSLRRCLVVLAAASARHTAAARTLFELLRRGPGLAAHMTGGVLQVVVDHAPDDLARAVDEAQPRFSTELLRPAYSLAQRLYDSLPTGAPPVHVAHRLSILGIRSWGVGDKRGALELTRRAVEIRRRLAKTEPGTHLAALASSLNNLGVYQWELEHKRDALASTREAVKIYRRLAKGDHAYLADLAGSLNNLGIRLSGVKNKRDSLASAREAVTIYRRLAKGDHTYSADLASSLHNLGACLWDIDDKSGALAPTQEAVANYRRLAEGESATYLPALATSLNNFGAYLSGVGRKHDALAPTLEAVEIRRQLAEAEPVAYLPDLASSLNNLGIRQSEIGNPHAALTAAQEAVEIRRRLAEAEPAAYLAALANSLNHLVFCLSKVENMRAALTTARETVEIRRRLAEAEPAAYLTALADSLDRLGFCLLKLENMRAALTSIREAEKIRQRLAEAEPSTRPPKLADSLNGSLLSSRVGDARSTLAPVDDAIDSFNQRLPETETRQLSSKSRHEPLVNQLNRGQFPRRIRRGFRRGR